MVSQPGRFSRQGLGEAVATSLLHAPTEFDGLSGTWIGFAGTRLRSICFSLGKDSRLGLAGAQFSSAAMFGLQPAGFGACTAVFWQTFVLSLKSAQFTFSDAGSKQGDHMRPIVAGICLDFTGPGWAGRPP